jgi:hypothetical protein
MNPQPVKSSFPKIQGHIDPALAQKITAPPSARKPSSSEQPQKKESLPPRAPEPLPSSVELWLEVVERQDREVFGWTLLATRTPKIKAILMPRRRGLMEQASGRTPCGPRRPPTRWTGAPTWARSRSGWGTPTCRPPASTTGVAPGPRTAPPSAWHN